MRKFGKGGLLRTTVLAGLAAAATSAAPALAQEAGDEEEAASDDRIVVTGSRIEREDNYSSVGPVETLGRLELELSAQQNIGDILQDLPSVTFISDGTNVNNGSAGVTSANLRGLGTERVLVLLNGRRVSPVGTGITSVTDLSIFPVSAVERVEVLKDGAAAVYGADAVAGVVNIITDRDFEGFDVTASTGESERGDGERWSIGANFGANFDRGNVMLGVAYQENEGVFQDQRSISECPYLEPYWGVLARDFFGSAPADSDARRLCSGSSFVLPGRFTTSGGLRTFDETGAIIPANTLVTAEFGGAAFNFNPENYLRTPSTSLNLISTARYDITDSIQATMEVLYSKRTSNQTLAPVPMGSGANFTYGLTIPSANPFNPFGEDVLYRKRMLDVGPRIVDQESDTIRVLFGLTGDLPAGLFNNGSWEVSYSADRNNGTESTRNLIDMLRVEQALSTETTTNTGAGTVTVGGTNYQCDSNLSRQLGCAPLNLFGFNSITPEAAEFIRLNTVDRFSTTGELIQGVVSGDLFEAPAGPVAFAAGVELRTLEGRTDVDAAIANGYSSGNPANNTNGSIESVDYFGEIDMPLVAGQPFFEELSVNAAYRVSDYEQFDAGETYRLGFAWSPIPDLRVRGTVSTSYRAPSLSNLFNGGSGGFPTYNDPCAIPTLVAEATAAGVCAAEGVVPGVFTTTNSQILSFSVGSRIVGNELDPEEGEQTTFGFVWQPSFGIFEEFDFNFAADYYEVTVSQPISLEGLQGIINDCYLDADALSCSKITRQTGGDILRVDRSFINDAAEETSEGIDFSIDGGHEAGPGYLGLRVNGTWNISREDTDTDTGTSADFVGGCFGFTAACFNEWRVNTTVTYDWNNLRLAWTSRFLSEIDRDEQDARDLLEGLQTFVTPAPTNAFINAALDDYTIDPFWYHDVNARYQINDTIAISGGVDNLFNEEPPFLKYVNGFFDPTENTPVGTYDTLGRFFYVRVDASF